MLEQLMKEAAYGYTENGAVTLRSSGSDCLDLFFAAGAMRNRSESDISSAVTRAFLEDPVSALRIVFFARDVRGGLGERRFFRTALECIETLDEGAVRRNMHLIPEYGRWDDLLVLLDTPIGCEAAEMIGTQLAEDTKAMENGGEVSLLAKWLPSENTSSEQTRKCARRLMGMLGMKASVYRKKLSKLRAYIDIIENRLREKDYTFDYSKQPSRAMLKYRSAFLRNDVTRYNRFIREVLRGESTLNAGTLYPYDIVRSCCNTVISDDEKRSLDAAWRSLPSFGESSENAIAVVDGSGSMYGAYNGNIRPIDVALSLGIYFAEHNKGGFAGHFITFSRSPQLVGIKGGDIFSKVQYCRTYNEVANTDLEAVFRLLLGTAVKNRLPRKDMPSKLYIISDMEFDGCIIGGSDDTLFRSMKTMYAREGYRLPDIVFWNVNSRSRNIPVSMKETGAALVSGASPSVFNMVMSGDVSPVKVMEDVLNSERYAAIR